MRVKNLVKLTAAAVVLATTIPAVHAQSSNQSPMLLIETGASDNPEYRRMTFVKYLNGGGVTVAYKAYNRTEFTQVQDTTPREVALNCVAGRPTSLSDLRSYERKEAKAKRRGEAPETTVFCIKDIRNWNDGNKEKYLDPIFNGMPYAKALN